MDMIVYDLVWYMIDWPGLRVRAGWDEERERERENSWGWMLAAIYIPPAPKRTNERGVKRPCLDRVDSKTVGPCRCIPT